MLQAGRAQVSPSLVTNSIPDNPIAPNARWTALALLSIAELLGMSLWFSASAVVPALRVEWNLSDSSASWLTIAVQLGFVLGTLLSALLNLPDIINVRALFAVSALAGALTNAAFGLYARGPQAGILVGRSWALAACRAHGLDLIPLVALETLLWSATFGPAIALRGMESPSSIFYARCVASGVSLAIGIPLTKAYGLLGVMWGIVLANAAAFVMTMYFLRSKLAAAEPPTAAEPQAA